MKAAEPLDGLVKLEQIVRPLEWIFHEREQTWTADSILGPKTYRAWVIAGTACVIRPGDRAGVIVGSTLDDAKAAADAHLFEALASALNLDPILSEIKRMREALKPFSEFAGPLFSLNRNASEPFYSVVDQDGNQRDLVIGDFFAARRALSTLSPQEPDNG